MIRLGNITLSTKVTFCFIFLPDVHRTLFITEETLPRMTKVNLKCCDIEHPQ
jgi:hypothetical protein